MENLNLAVRIVIYVALWSAAFVILWRLVLVFLSRLAGWPEVKRLYAIGRDYSEPVWRSASGYLGPVWYAGTLTLGSSPSGLYIAAQFPFHFGSAPVLIPWTDIEVSRERKLFQTQTYFRFLRIPGLALRVSGKGADWILEVAGPNAKR